MASQSILPLDSLDGTAEEFRLEQDHKRELDHKHKWALGEIIGGEGRRARQPMPPLSQAGKRQDRREVEHEHKKVYRMCRNSRKRASPYDLDSATSDSSAEEDVTEASAAPAPDAGIAYSFDAPRGPGRGSDILSMAITKAVERFETKVTEKLVKDEYEVVAVERQTHNEGSTADEDDFELV